MKNRDRDQRQRRDQRETHVRTQAADVRKTPSLPSEAAAKAPPVRREASRAPAGLSRIFGFHSVAAALSSPRRELVKLYATPAAAARLAPDIERRHVPVEILSPEEIDRVAPREAVHQGVVLDAHPLPPVSIDSLPENGLVLVLDQVSDPHNVGAILRTAAAFGVDALVTTERHSPEFDGTVAKAASGGVEFVPIAVVPNLARALSDLGDLGYWRIGLDSEAPGALTEARLERPLALVLGAEGKGLRRLTRERCDALARLDLPGPIKSLNVSNACAVALTLAAKTPPR